MGNPTLFFRKFNPHFPAAITRLLFFVSLLVAEALFIAPLSALAQCRVYWSQGAATGIEGGIFRSRADGTQKSRLIPLGAFAASAVDSANQRMYWIVAGTGIYRQDLFYFGTVERHDSKVVSDIAVNDVQVASNKLYYSTSTQIIRADLDGSNPVTLVTESGGIANIMPGTLRVSPDDGKIFWANYHGLRSADLDGTNPQYVASGPAYNFAKALEVGSSVLYFIDLDDAIRRINFDGTGDTTLRAGSEELGDLLIDTVGSRLLFANHGTHAIEAIPLGGGSSTQIAAGTGDVLGMAFDSSDPVFRRLYFTSAKFIGRAVVSTGSTTLHYASLQTPNYISLGSNGRIYTSSPDSGAVVEARLDGTEALTLVKGLVQPAGVKLIGGTDLLIADRGAGKIYSFRSNVLTELVSGLGQVEDVTYQYPYIYWTENDGGAGMLRRGVYPELGQVATPETLATGGDLVHGIDADPRSGNIIYGVNGSAARRGGVLAMVSPVTFTQYVSLDPVTVIGPGPVITTHYPEIYGVSAAASIYAAEAVTTWHIVRGFRSGDEQQEMTIPDGVPYGVAVLRNDAELCGETEDIDGDSQNEYAVWRRATGTWYVSRSTDDTLLSRQWGLPGDLPLAGDFDGDGRQELTVWRPSNGTWYHCLSSENYDCSAPRVRQFGLPGDYPVLADLDGDGKDDETVWRPASGQWYYFSSQGGALQTFQWGLPGDYPLAADFDDDGIDDPAVWRPAEGKWYILKSRNNLSTAAGQFSVVQWGLSSDHPLAADFDGDGVADLAVWRPSNGNWYLCESSRDFVCGGQVVQRQFGLPADIPLLADLDGDKRKDLTVWREFLANVAEGQWYSAPYVEPNELAVAVSRQFGLRGDVPVNVGPRTAGKILYGRQ